MLITNLLEQRSFYGKYTELSNNLLNLLRESYWPAGVFFGAAGYSNR